MRQIAEKRDVNLYVPPCSWTQVQCGSALQAAGGVVAIAANCALYQRFLGPAGTVLCPAARHVIVLLAVENVIHVVDEAAVRENVRESNRGKLRRHARM